MTQSHNSSSRPLFPAYISESLSSVGTTLLMVGIFFYTEHYFHWGPVKNCLLAAGQGAAYAFGSLAAQHLAARLGRRNTLIGLYFVLVCIAVLACATRTAAQLLPLLIIYTLFAAANWPLLESLVCSGAGAHELSRRVGRYNLVWSLTNASTFALSGMVIQHWPMGLFILAAIAHAVAALVMWMNPRIDPREVQSTDSARAEPEPVLRQQRTLALWLARISLPATYVVIYSLMAIMPSLPVMRPLDTTARTLVGSTWMAARVLAFLILGATVWWHTRPRVLLVAASGMFLAFLGVTLRLSQILPALEIPYAADLIAMLGWQIALGILMGMIYAGSLYFGMVLSDGSTEHGGYHEALIGVGSVLGPGVAALAQSRWPGDLHAGVAAVSCVICISLAAAVWVSVRRQESAP